jgi:hypothetical protein
MDYTITTATIGAPNRHNTAKRDGGLRRRCVSSPRYLSFLKFALAFIFNQINYHHAITHSTASHDNGPPQ